MLSIRIYQGPAMLWFWENKVMKTEGWRLVAAEPHPQPCQCPKRWLARACWGKSSKAPSPHSLFLSLHWAGHMLERDAEMSCTVAHRSLGDVHTDEWITSEGAGGTEGHWHGVHLQYRAHKTPGTCKIQIKESQKGWREGKGQGRFELSNSKCLSKMLCWGRGRVTSVVVLSLIHDSHCLNIKWKVKLTTQARWRGWNRTF